jgi:UDP-N-acetyl-D-mannosaminuronic acid transferase (WecB/TagA/CpsF family)
MLFHLQRTSERTNLFPSIQMRPPQRPELPVSVERDYRRILGVRFFAGDAPEAVAIGARGGLVVCPAAPALLELGRDRAYRQALLEADLAITDSGFLVLLWNLMMWDRIHRVSGLEYLKLLLKRPEFGERGAALLVMPSQISLERNLHWLQAQGYAIQREDCYVAPKYGTGAVADDSLVKLINERQPRHVIIGLGGGVQEKLGLYLKKTSAARPAIHCIGAAIGFLSGDQVGIPAWADQWILGWLFRCAADPGRFVPRYLKALQLPMLLWKYRGRMPELRAES